MANEPRGPKGPSEPKGPTQISGIDEKWFSENQREAMEQLAERDRWHEARDAFAPGNRPVIFHQLNPLAIPAKYRDLPEFWTVYVPRTNVAWSTRQIDYDYRTRVSTTALTSDGNSETPTAEEQSRVRAARQDESAISAAKKSRQLVAFGSAAEAERFAQDAWRKHWAQQLPKQSQASREAFAENAVINVIRREAFSMDAADPAHVAQYEVWRAQYPAGLPNGVVVHQRNVDFAGLDLPSRRPELADDDLLGYPEPNRTGWDIERPRVHEDNLAWDVRSIGDKTWVLVRNVAPPKSVLAGKDEPEPEPAPVWEFYRNGTGRVVAFEAQEAKKVEAIVPKGVPIDIGNLGTKAPSQDELRELWMQARQRDHSVAWHPAVQSWLTAEQELGQSLKRLMAADPTQGDQLKPVLRSIADVHSLIMTPDGVIADSPAQLEKAYGMLSAAVQQQIAPGAQQEQLLAKVQHWHQQGGALSQESLGLFRYDRIPDIAFVDADVEPVARLDGTGDWVAHRTPSGEFLLARFNTKGELQRVDLPTYPDPESVRVRVADQGGHLTWERLAAIQQRWEKTVHQTYGPDAQKRIDAVMTPSRTLRKQAFEAAQAADPKVVQPEPEAPRRTLFVTPLGGGRALVWQEAADASRKSHEPEFMAWKNDELVALNKHRGQWMPVVGKDETQPVWSAIPETKKPWIVESAGGPVPLTQLISDVQARVPDADVKPSAMNGAGYLIRALAERYGLQPEPLTNKEALWTVHPTPDGKIMVSTREWVAQEKADHPGEYQVYAVAKPIKRPDNEVASFSSPQVVERELKDMGLLYEVRNSMPPEVGDWFDRRLLQSVRETPAVRMGAVEPLTAVAHANRFTQESVMADLRDAQREAKLPRGVRRMQRQILAGASRGLTAEDFETLMPDAPQATGVTWKEAEQQVRAFAHQWLTERPKLAERLTRPQPAPRQTVNAAAVSVPM